MKSKIYQYTFVTILLLFSNFSFAETTTLTSGETIYGFVSDGSMEYYQIIPSATDTSIEIILDSPKRNAFLYYRQGSLPSAPAETDCQAVGIGRTIESCTIDLKSSEVIYIGAYGYENSIFSLKTTLKGAASVSSKPTLISPSGTLGVLGNTPTYKWNAVTGATWYYLWVNDSAGNKIKKWYTATQANCSNGSSTCSVTPSTILSNGSAKWWIKTWNSAGYGDWSSNKNFSIGNSVSVPAQATLISPSGTISDTSPTYRWNAVSGATQYQLWVNDNTGNKVKLYTSAQSICGESICSITPITPLARGSAQWWVRALNSPSTEGQWSNNKDFAIGAGIPSTPTLISPSWMNCDTTPTYIWNAVKATHYQLWVADSTGNKISTWYTSSQVSCSSGTGTCAMNPSVVLDTGAIWKVRAENSVGSSAWSSYVPIGGNTCLQ